MYVNKDIDYLKYLNNKRVIIFGAGYLGKRTFANLTRSVENIEVIAFCDNDKKKQNTNLMGIKIVSADELHNIMTNETMIIVCSNFEREIKEQLIELKIYNFISVSQIDFGCGEDYYDEQYFAWQQSMGVFGGKISARMFQPHIKEDATVIEFGCGGGYLLDNIIAKEKIGIEINDVARATASKIGIKSVKDVDDIPDNYADVIISTHVLEHVENPLGVLRALHKKLKDGGKIVFYVPNESCDTEYCRSEINNHLYTWNCLTIGNLFKTAGYFVQSVKKIQEIWPIHYNQIESEVSPEFFDAICYIGGKASNENNCLIVAYK